MEALDGERLGNSRAVIIQRESVGFKYTTFPSFTELTTLQFRYVAFLKSLAHLKFLDVSLSGVHPLMFASALNGLKSVELIRVGTVRLQCAALFEMMLEQVTYQFEKHDNRRG